MTFQAVERIGMLEFASNGNFSHRAGFESSACAGCMSCRHWLLRRQYHLTCWFRLQLRNAPTKLPSILGYGYVPSGKPVCTPQGLLKPDELCDLNLSVNSLCNPVYYKDFWVVSSQLFLSA